MPSIFKRLFLILTVICHPLCAQNITIGATQWTGFTNADESGVYFELLKQIYADDTLSFKFNTYNRMLFDFQKHRIDIAIGIYKEDAQQAIFPKWFLDMEEPITAYYHPETDISNLDNLTIAWMRGYKFERFIPIVKTPYLINTYQDGLNLLINKRLDVFIDYPYNLPAQYQHRLASFEVMPKRRIYLAFQKNKLGKQLADHFDKKMLELRNSGKLAEIFGEYYQGSNLEKFVPSKESVTIITKAINYIKPKLQAKRTEEPIENKILSLVTERIEHYNIEFQVLDNYTNLEQYQNTDNICFSNMVKTDARAQKFIFSKPMMFYMGMRLYSKSPLNSEQPIDIAKLMATDNKKTLGLVEQQSYGNNLDSELKHINTTQLIFTPFDTLSNLKIFDAGRFDYRLGYPSVIAHYWPKLSNSALYSAEIKGAEHFILGHLMCSNTEASQKFIAQFNEQLTALYPSQAFYNLHYVEIDEGSRSDFNKYFQQVFAVSENKKPTTSSLTPQTAAHK